MRAVLVCWLIVLLGGASARAQDPAPADGWVVISLDEYRALRLAAYPPDTPPDPPPVEATLTRVEYELRVTGDSIAGEARLTVDVLKDGWVRVDIPAGLLVRAARVDGRPVAVVDKPAPHVLLSRAGRVVVSLDVVIAARMTADAEALTVPPSPGAVSRVAVVIPRDGIDVVASGGVLVERPQQQDGRWIAYGRGGQPLTLTWKRRSEAVRATQPLKWRGAVTELVTLGEEASPVTATVHVEVTSGTASTIEVAIPESIVVNQVSGALVADWDFQPGALKVSFLEALTTQTSFAIAGEARVAREGTVGIPLIRLPAAEREVGAIAVDVLGASEIHEQPQARGLEPTEPSELGEPVKGRESPSMVAFRYRPQDGRSARSLAVNVARYTPHAVLVANVEEARYDALVSEEGKTLVRARYGVRNNQRGFLTVMLPGDSTLWSASVAGRPVRPGVGSGGALLLPLEKGYGGEETPTFAVELIYVQRSGQWNDKGRVALSLPAIDLPVSRTGLVVHHSPRFRVNPEPGSFRVEMDPGPFTAALSTDESATTPGTLAAAPPTLTESEEDALVREFRKDTAGKAVVGRLPIRMPFPELGPRVFLMSELTAESKAPSIEFTYKREDRW